MTTTYSDVTETPGVGASLEQLRMLVTRYGLAAREVGRGVVLEVACGTGIGLAYLAREASRVVGVDIDPTNVSIARRTYAGDATVAIEQGDAARLPGGQSTFDAVVCFEAIYYFPDLWGFLIECRRVLKPGGKLVLCSVNPRWSGFNTSPYATRYWSPAELSNELLRAGFRARFWWAFPDKNAHGRGAAIAAIRRIAVRWHLIPRTMRGKVLLKRLFYGRVAALPERLDPGVAEPDVLRVLDNAAVGFPGKIYYAVAELRGDRASAVKSR